MSEIKSTMDEIEELCRSILGADFTEKTAVYKNAKNPQECRVYVLFDDGRYDGPQYYYKELNNCPEEGYSLLSKLPSFLGIKETKFFHWTDFEFNGYYTNALFLEDCGIIW